MKRLALLSVAVLAACGQRSDAQEPAADAEPVAAVTVSDAWCRPSPNGAQAGACYATLISDADDRLMGGSTPFAADLQVHEMTTEGGVMKMRPIAGLELRQGQAVMLRPGGNHIMLVGLARPLTAGETVPLTLEFAAAPAVTVQAAVGQGPGSGAVHAGH